MNISRRDFLKGGAALAATAAVTGLGVSAFADDAPAAEAAASWRVAPAPIPESEIAETLDCDILVVGLGYSGIPATRAAAEANPDLHIIAIDKLFEEQHPYHGHDFGHINSKQLEKLGVAKVDPIEFMNNWQVMSGNKSNPALVREFAFKSGEALDWFFEAVSEEDLALGRVSFGVEGEQTVHDLNTGILNYTGCIQFNAAREDGTHLDGQDLLWQNTAYIRANCPNADLYFNTSAEQAVMDGEKFAGIIAKREDGSYVKILAKKTILASGGFGANKEMCDDLLPDVNYLTDENDKEVLSLKDQDGIGIRLATWAGGRMESGPVPTMGFDTVQAPKALLTLWLDENGERFSNEVFAGPEFTGFIIARLCRRMVVSVFDSDLDKMLNTNLPGHRAYEPTEANNAQVKQLCADAAAAKEAGVDDGRGNIFYCADDLETLADYIGYEGNAKENFIASVARYNELCAAGRDEDFGKDPRFLHPIVAGPFYAAINVPRPGSDLVTVGGMLTDKNQQVLNMARRPIEGLYATGNCCGMRFGTDYITPIPGVSLGMAITLGRSVGLHCAEELS